MREYDNTTKLIYKTHKMISQIILDLARDMKAVDSIPIEQYVNELNKKTGHDRYNGKCVMNSLAKANERLESVINARTYEKLDIGKTTCCSGLCEGCDCQEGCPLAK